MEAYTSQLPAKAYCKILRQKLDNPFCVYDERITGIVVGPFFSIAHHAQWEWNRRITGECNRAWGFVREKNGETEIRFIRGKGMFAPGWLLFWTLISRAICLIVELQDDFYFEVNFAWRLSAILALIVCAVSALESSLTEAGETGAWELNKFLQNPEEYYF